MSNATLSQTLKAVVAALARHQASSHQTIRAVMSSKPSFIVGIILGLHDFRHKNVMFDTDNFLVTGFNCL